jgi:glutamine cyclotransferase
MAKQKRETPSEPTGSTWRRRLAELLVILILLGVILLFATATGQSIIDVALVGTATPTSIPTVTPTSTATPSPTATPLPTATPVPSTPAPAATDSPIPNSGNPAEIPVYGYRVVNSYPHDPDAFIQGLVFEDGIFYEGTGRRGQSTLRQVEVETGQVLQAINLPAEVFGEGITIFGDRIIQLTWQARTGFIYDKPNFEFLDIFRYPTEGWGITHDGQRLIMSDGTSTLYLWDLDTLEEIGRIQVEANGQPVARLNELEYINGEIFANVWQTDRIARIDPGTGQVVGWIDLTGLLSPADRGQRTVDVLNGIAYDAENDRLFVTGKLWPRLYEIELVAPE